MVINKEQKKFWNILSEPYKKNCDNCHWHKFNKSPDYVKGGCHGKIGPCINNFDNTSQRESNKWKWDEIEYDG